MDDQERTRRYETDNSTKGIYVYFAAVIVVAVLHLGVWPHVRPHVQPNPVPIAPTLHWQGARTNDGVAISCLTSTEAQRVRDFVGKVKRYTP